MGDVAEMMLDGTLCEGCGVYLGANTGDPERCKDCKREDAKDRHAAVLAHHQQIKKVPCPTCGQRVKAVGLADHIRDSHSQNASTGAAA